VWITSRALPDQIEITISDTGTGIAPEDQPRVFERFYRVDPARARSTGGAGLGLTIARAFVRAMGGEIGVNSRLGDGSHFWIRLPRAEQARPDRKPVGLARP
jgi:signal transduction histidine kinase